MIGYILKYILGFVQIETANKGNTRLLNLIKNKNISMWGISENPDVISFFICYRDRNKLSDIAKKAGCEYKIIGSYGLPVKITQNKGRYSVILGIIIFIVLIYIESLFIWNIRIEGEEDYTKDEIIEALSSLDISYGSYIKDIDTVSLERQLRQKFEDIAWISCSIRGTCLYIDIKETLDVFTDTSLDVPSNIISVRDCTIYSIITSEGTPVVKIGDEVKKGDILVSGTVNLYDDNAEIMDTHYIPAKADVKGITRIKYYDSISLVYYKKEYSKNDKSDYTFSIFGYKIRPYKAKVNYSEFDTVSKDCILHIKNLYFPFGYTKNTYREYSLIMKEYSNEEVTLIANTKLKQYICDLQEKGVQILENNVKISFEDGKCIAEGDLVAIMNIGIGEEFDIGKEDLIIE